jgi:hypothetical protein
MTRWEYKVVKAASLSTLEQQLNELGEKGWELVHVRETRGGIKYGLDGPHWEKAVPEYYFLLKRPKEYV